MTAAAPTSTARQDWWARPRVVLPVVGAIVLVVALLTPQPSQGRLGDQRLSSHLAGSLGARAFAEAAGRFGFQVAQRDSAGAPDLAAPRGQTIHAVLGPPVRITGPEAHAYLEAVRGGDALLLVIDERNAISDSLGLWRGPSGVLERPPIAERYGCRRDLTPPLWPDGRVHLFSLRWLRPAPGDRRVFAMVRSDREVVASPREAFAGFALGRGRVVAIPDPDLLRNDVIRRCDWGTDVLAMRALEWLRAGGDRPRDALVFDEYHQGYGPRPSAMGTAAHFLFAHPVGRGLLTLTIAGFVLLAAAAPRPLPPSDPPSIERRDPMEQVDALAHAYEQIGATRTLTLRLLRGVRSRIEGGGPSLRSATDEAFLAAAESADPGVSGDVALVRRALREPVATHELSDVGGALRRIELSLTATTA